MCLNTHGHTVCGKPLSVIASSSGPASRIPWCPGVRRAVYQVAAHFRLSPSNIRTLLYTEPSSSSSSSSLLSSNSSSSSNDKVCSVFDLLCRQTNCYHPDHPQFSHVVEPKLERLVRSALYALHEEGRIVIWCNKGSTWKEAYWPEFTRIWVTPDWDGMFGDETVDESLRKSLAEVCLGGTVPEAARATMAMGDTQTQTLSQPQQRWPAGACGLPMLSGAHGVNSGGVDTSPMIVVDDDQAGDRDDDDASCVTANTSITGTTGITGSSTFITESDWMSEDRRWQRGSHTHTDVDFAPVSLIPSTAASRSSSPGVRSRRGFCNIPVDNSTASAPTFAPAPAPASASTASASGNLHGHFMLPASPAPSPRAPRVLAQQHAQGQTKTQTSSTLPPMFSSSHWPGTLRSETSTAAHANTNTPTRFPSSISRTISQAAHQHQQRKHEHGVVQDQGQGRRQDRGQGLGTSKWAVRRRRKQQKLREAEALLTVAQEQQDQRSPAHHDVPHHQRQQQLPQAVLPSSSASPATSLAPPTHVPAPASMQISPSSPPTGYEWVLRPRH